MTVSFYLVSGKIVYSTAHCLQRPQVTTYSDMSAMSKVVTPVFVFFSNSSELQTHICATSLLDKVTNHMWCCDTYVLCLKLPKST